MKAGHYKPGSLSAQIQWVLHSSPVPMGRLALREAVGPQPYPNFSRTLAAMELQGVVRQCRDGFSLAGPAQQRPPISDPPPLISPSPDLAAQLSRMVARAHALRLAGARDRAADFLREAARKLGASNLADDMLALADLFSAHAETFPTVDLMRRAA